MMSKPFTVCALFYGDYPQLAERCLYSMLQPAAYKYVREYRLGLNAVSLQTEATIRQQLAGAPAHRPPAYLYKTQVNVCKYPLMRRMFYAEPAIQTPRVMWFDDDSAIAEPSDSWWQRVAQVALQHTLIGSVYRMDMGAAGDAIRRQSWYTARPFRRRKRGAIAKNVYSFVTGGWWCLDFQFACQHDYPFPGLIHNGGDRILGELVYQQHGTMQEFRDGLLINADADGKESAAARRGVSQRAHEVWPVVDPPKDTDGRYKHQNFDYETEAL